MKEKSVYIKKIREREECEYQRDKGKRRVQYAAARIHNRDVSL